jgi:hypothetical protein
VLNVKCFFAEFSTATVAMPKVKTSWVWDYFVTDSSSGDRKCKRCPYVDRSKSTTSAMAAHLRDAHKVLRPSSDCDAEKAGAAGQSGSSLTSSESSDRDVSKIGKSNSSLLRFLSNKQRTVEEWCTRMAVEDGLSFNQIASSEFVAKAFSNLGLRHPKSRTTVSNYVNSFITGMVKETKEELVKAFQNGVRFSVVIDEWTSINNRRFLNVCVVTMDSCNNLGLARCRGSMTAVRTTELLQVKQVYSCKGRIRILILRELMLLNLNLNFSTVPVGTGYPSKHTIIYFGKNNEK